MKKITPLAKDFKLFMLFIAILSFVSCKKDTGGSNTTRKPNSILYNWEYNGTTWVWKGFMLLDLDHAENKDKSFIVVDVADMGGGKMKFTLRRGPLPIDSLSTNWPAAVRKVSFGYSNDITVDAYTRMQSTTTGPRFTYRYDSLHKFPTSIYLVNYLQNPLYAGSMAGKTPQGRGGSWVANASNKSTPHDVIYYFKESAYSSVISPGHGGVSLTEYIGSGVSTTSERWKSVDAALTVEGNKFHHLYFDFDSWQYFVVRDWCPSSYGNECDKGGLQELTLQSMDNLMEWPKGWGK